MKSAGQTALKWLYGTRPRRKEDGSEVTDADRAAEEVILEALSREFPGFAIVAEEGSHVEGDAGTWYVDPIDGTSAFIEGLAHWGPTVALAQEGRLKVGAYYAPRLDELWFARRGSGAWRNDHRLAPEPLEAIGRNDSLYVPSRFHRAMPLPWPGKCRSLGSTAAHLAHVAAGGGAATVIGRWAMWDVGCGVLLVSEAGRQVIDLTGDPFEPISLRGAPFAAGDPVALKLLVDNLRTRRRAGVDTTT